MITPASSASSSGRPLHRFETRGSASRPGRAVESQSARRRSRTFTATRYAVLHPGIKHDAASLGLICGPRGNGFGDWAPIGASPCPGVACETHSPPPSLGWGGVPPRNCGLVSPLPLRKLHWRVAAPGFWGRMGGGPPGEPMITGGGVVGGAAGWPARGAPWTFLVELREGPSGRTSHGPSSPHGSPPPHPGGP